MSGKEASKSARSPKKAKKSDPSAAAFAEAFGAFCVFGDRQSDGSSITLKNIDKWLKQAGILDGKKITNADTAITFSKVVKTAKRMVQMEFEAFLEQLASDKGMTKDDLMAKLMANSEPGLQNVTTTSGGAAGANVDRMTDTSKYTGSHKERFDDEGKGRGIEGREESSTTDGYVSGFKRKDDKK